MSHSDHPAQCNTLDNAPLEISPDRFREIGHRLVDRIADHLSGLSTQRVSPGESTEVIRQVLQADRSLPKAGADAADLVANAAELLFSHSVFNGHPRFFGYITSSAAPIGMLADLLAASVNPNVGAWKLSPAATEIEAQTIRWIAEFIGYPPQCGGLLVSGGNMANFVCFLAARVAQAEWDTRKLGLRAPEARALRCYASTETHTWIQKAADLFGLGTDSIRWTPVDHHRRMNVTALKKQVSEDLSNGDQPFLVIGTAGSVSTGAVDPLPELAAFCRENNLWFHVDGAYGGFAAKAPGAPSDLAALSHADSVAIDPHKWLYAPLEAGCALVRDPANLRNAFSYHPAYYNFESEALNYFDLGPQNSRGFRALKVWLALQQAGSDGYHSMIGENIELARRLHSNLAAHPEFQTLTQELSISTFRYVPPELRSGVGTTEVEPLLNHVNQELLNRVEQSGEAFLSNAVIEGQYVLRVCIVNFRTRAADVDALPEIIASMGRGVYAEFRHGGVAS